MMSLNHLCKSGTKRASFSSTTPPFIVASVHTEDINDVKLKPPMERCNSLTSTLSFSGDICRICHCEEDDDMPLISPCICHGSLRYVHQSCLQQWIKSSDTKSCELCKFLFVMHTKVKPFNKWERLEMSGMERRKLLCSVAFHAIAVTCVVWSLHILIERTTEDVRADKLTWSFWTKLIVIAIGLTGSIVFMYVQCKMYFQLFKRWRAFNRVIYVQNAPEKIPLTQSEKSLMNEESSRRSPLDSSSEVEKPFLGVAVITSTSSSCVSNQHSSLSTSTNSTTAAGAVCISTTASSPPGAIWADDLSQPPLSTFSYFNTGLPNRKRGPLESDHLISPSQRLISTVTTTSSSNSGRSSFRSSRSDSPPSTTTRVTRTTTKEASLPPPPPPKKKKTLEQSRIVHTPNDSFRSRSRQGSDDSSDLETLHLDST